MRRVRVYRKARIRVTDGPQKHLSGYEKHLSVRRVRRVPGTFWRVSSLLRKRRRASGTFLGPAVPSYRRVLFSVPDECFYAPSADAWPAVASAEAADLVNQELRPDARDVAQEDEPSLRTSSLLYCFRVSSRAAASICAASRSISTSSQFSSVAICAAARIASKYTSRSSRMLYARRNRTCSSSPRWADEKSNVNDRSRSQGRTRCLAVPGEPEDIEVVHARIAEQAVVFADERLDAEHPHELREVEPLADDVEPHRIIRLVHVVEQIANRAVQLFVRFGFVGSRLEERLVRREVRPEIVAEEVGSSSGTRRRCRRSLPFRARRSRRRFPRRGRRGPGIRC